MTNNRPDFILERAARDQGYAPIAGADEAGRGPLAGPVIAAAVIFPADFADRTILDGLDDSKKLSPAHRAALRQALQRIEGVFYAVGEASVNEIDRLNILQATLLAFRRAVASLSLSPGMVLMDGNTTTDFACPARCVVKGDSRSFSIAAASVIAKEVRDDIMRNLHRAYPEYGWADNMGYGTVRHRDALVRYGPCIHHRRSFRPVKELL